MDWSVGSPALRLRRVRPGEPFLRHRVVVQIDIAVTVQITTNTAVRLDQLRRQRWCGRLSSVPAGCRASLAKLSH